MFCFLSCNVFLFLLLLLAVGSETHLLIPAARRAMIFEDTRDGRALTNFAFMSHTEKTQSQCSKFCLSTPTCLSFNFHRLTGLCQLNSEDSHSTGAEFEHGAELKYVGIKTEDTILCEEKGLFKNLTSPSKNWCAISQKRHDIQWSEWEHFVEVDSSEEWKKVEKRECVPQVFTAHGGCSDLIGESKRVIEWFRFVTEEKNFQAAKENCENLGGNLFYKVNGTINQLKFLHDKLNGGISAFRIGVWSSDRITWKGLDGHTISNDLLVWWGSEPNTNNYFYVKARSTGLTDAGDTVEYPSVCDMR